MRAPHASRRAGPRASVLCGLLLAFVAFVPLRAVPWDGVRPPTFEATLAPEQTTSFLLEVRTGDQPVSKIDVIFAIDMTSSMSDEIDVVKERATEIMNAIRKRVPDSRFGLVTFSDYPGSFSYPGYSDTYGSPTDTPFSIDCQPTEDISAVTSAIRRISLRQGEDGPEDYTRVLFEAISVEWRVLIKKLVILFGDAPTHDLDFAGYNNGGDPGRDGTAGTDDDLDFETVVRQVSEEGISVLAVDSGGTEESAATFKAMSIGFAEVDGTSGRYFLLSEASEIPDVVRDLVDAEVSSIEKLDIVVPSEYSDWLTREPKSFENVGPNQTKAFDITLGIPDDQDTGIYTFLIRAVGDGALVGSCVAELTVPGKDGGQDLGFRPDPDGFGMRNKSDSDYPWSAFEQLFGADAVLHVNGDRRYAAEQYYLSLYDGKGPKGLCHGMSACAIINFSASSQPNADRKSVV